MVLLTALVRAGTGMCAGRLHQDEAGTVTDSVSPAPGATAVSAGAAKGWAPTGIAQLVGAPGGRETGNQALSRRCDTCNRLFRRPY